mgnify:CR=1 FL=1
MRQYYAQRSPRGFANEIVTYACEGKAWRDRFCQLSGAVPCTAKQARKTVGYKGDAATKSYNSSLRIAVEDASEPAGWFEMERWGRRGWQRTG